MTDPHFVQPVMKSLKFLCWGVLAFYVSRVFISVVRGPSQDGSRGHGLREAMAMAYTAVAAYLIASAAGAIQLFVTAILDSVSLLQTGIESWVLTLLVLSSSCVCAAFICNFSRSLWMLKSLDHAVYGPVPEWGALSEISRWKKLAEFSTRTVAALLFIVVEFRLERFADAQTSANALTLASMDELQHNSLSEAGRGGLWLYFALILWWCAGFWIARKQMPKLQLVFYIAGMADSFFIYRYATTLTNSSDAITFLLFIVVISICALYMLCIVLLDPLSDLRQLAIRVFARPVQP
jgi:hypothetical protein